MTPQEILDDLNNQLERRLKTLKSFRGHPKVSQETNEVSIEYCEAVLDFIKALGYVPTVKGDKQPPAIATPARQCACGKPLHACDTGDVCPACAHKFNRSIAPF